MAPSPVAGPSKEILAAGSTLAQGDQASHLWKSFTWAKTSAGVAAILVDLGDAKIAGKHGHNDQEDDDQRDDNQGDFLKAWELCLP